MKRVRGRPGEHLYNVNVALMSFATAIGCRPLERTQLREKARVEQLLDGFPELGLLSADEQLRLIKYIFCNVSVNVWTH